jgi:ribosomal-protein-alanine N-acetyltransferase
VRTLIQSATARVMVAEDGNRIVGWSAGLVRRHPRSRSGRIYNVAVHPEYRGQRIGRRLVEEALRAFAADGIHCVYLEVREDNEVASQLYRSMGFADHRQLPDYYGTGVHARSMLWTGAPATAESMEMATVTAAAV